MRTISQTFADALRDKDRRTAQYCIRQHGVERTRALEWLAISGDIDDEWMAVLAQTSVEPAAAGQALLMALAPNTPWRNRQQFCAWLVQHVDADWMEHAMPIHHAAFHGCHEAFPLLLQHHQKCTHMPFDWNATTTEGHTPLYLALSQGHLDTTAAVVVKGGLPTFLMSDPKSPTKKTSVLSRVYQEKQSSLAMIKQIWHAASDKAAMAQAVEASDVPPNTADTDTAKTSGKKRRKKI